MKRRKIVHPQFPFTEAEHAAAWILLGETAQDAIRDSAVLAAELPTSLEATDAANAESGWAVKPSVHFVGSFAPAIHLAADICSGGTILSEPARAAWLEHWDVRLDPDEADRRVAQLVRLGPEWSSRRSVFYRLLTDGTL